MDGWMDGWMDGRTDGRTHERTDGRTDRQIDRKTDRRTDRQTDRQTESIIRCMRFACRVTKARVQTHLPNIYYLLLLHGNSGYANAPPCHMFRSLIACLVICAEEERPGLFST
jgi:hypothetical protein